MSRKKVLFDQSLIDLFLYFFCRDDWSLFTFSQTGRRPLKTEQASVTDCFQHAKDRRSLEKQARSLAAADHHHHHMLLFSTNLNLDRNLLGYRRLRISIVVRSSSSLVQSFEIAERTTSLHHHTDITFEKVNNNQHDCR